jgi:hypothetical protein
VRTEPIVAAIFNTSPDIVDMMRRAFEPAGIVTVRAVKEAAHSRPTR